MYDAIIPKRVPGDSRVAKAPSPLCDAAGRTAERSRTTPPVPVLNHIRKEEAIAKKKKRETPAWPPKGAYPLPNGNYMHEHASIIKGRKTRIAVELKAEPDLEQLTKALLELGRLEAQRRVKPKGNRVHMLRGITSP